MDQAPAEPTGYLSLYRRIASGLERHPAYLLVFAVCALFVLSGLLSTGAAIVQGKIEFGLLALASFGVALFTVVVVVRFVETLPGRVDPHLRVRSRPPANEDLPLVSEKVRDRVTTPRLGKIPRTVTVEQQRAFLAAHPDWDLLETRDARTRDGMRRELYRVFEFPNFDHAFGFMRFVAENAIKHHHPRWQNTYNRLEVWLTTFNCDYQLSTKDIRLGEQIEELWKQYRTRF